LFGFTTTVSQVDFDVYEVGVDPVDGGGQSTKEHVR
jgi:hypothetical protein